MTRTLAIKEARKLVSMRRQDNAWVLSAWDTDTEVCREGNPIDYWKARVQATNNKLRLALEIMGYDYEHIQAVLYNFSLYNPGTRSWTDYVR
jgi:hypothetical protein